MNKLKRGYQVRSYGDSNNLFKVELLKVFKNIKSIFIDLCGFGGYTVSLSSLLSLIMESTSLQKIILQIGAQEEKHKFIKCYLISSSLEKEYKKQKFNIKIKENTGDRNMYIWCIIDRI